MGYFYNVAQATFSHITHMHYVSMSRFSRMIFYILVFETQFTRSYSSYQSLIAFVCSHKKERHHCHFHSVSCRCLIVLT